MGFVTILRPHLTDLEYRSKKSVLRASAGRSGIGPSPRMPRPKNSTGRVPENRGEKPDLIIGSSEPWRGKSIETSNAQIQARPRSGARGCAVRFLGAAQGRTRARSRRRPQKRDQGTGAG